MFWMFAACSLKKFKTVTITTTTKNVTHWHWGDNILTSVIYSPRLFLSLNLREDRPVPVTIFNQENHKKKYWWCSVFHLIIPSCMSFSSPSERSSGPYSCDSCCCWSGSLWSCGSPLCHILAEVSRLYEWVVWCEVSTRHSVLLLVVFSCEVAELQLDEYISLYKHVWVPTVAIKCHKNMKSPISSQSTNRFH